MASSNIDFAVCSDLVGREWSPSTLDLILGNGFITFLFVCGVWAIVIWSGVLNWFEPYHRNVRLLSKIKGMINAYVGAIPDAKPSLSQLSINTGRRSASVACTHFGREYLLTLPFWQDRMSHRHSKKMFLVKSDDGDNVSFDVTLPPGCAYLFSAADLGGTRLEWRSDHSLIKTFTGTQVPDSNVSTNWDH